MRSQGTDGYITRIKGRGARILRVFPGKSPACTWFNFMPRPVHATIHPAALHHNLERVRRSAPDAKVWAVVKANAYGHGIERVYEGLRGADGFALLDLAEAERVRHLG